MWNVAQPIAINVKLLIERIVVPQSIRARRAIKGAEDKNACSDRS